MNPTKQTFQFSYPRPRQQRGITLIMGLMFLVVLTLLGLAAMRGTILEERMAGNARDRNLAFQAAEAALRVGEQIVTSGVEIGVNPGEGRFARIPNGTLNGYWQDSHDWDAQSKQLTAEQWSAFEGGTSEAPRYVIEDLGISGGGGSGLGVGPLSNEGVFRVTARGVGGNANTVVILQAIYQR